jgi:Ca2+-binding EF-hand superfamily protein
MKIGKYGCTVGQLKAAAKLIKERLLMKNATVMKALRDVDESGDGVLSREEIITLLKQYYLIKYTDFYTGEVRGDLDMFVVDTLLDFVDKTGDGIIDYTEFTKVLTTDDIMAAGIVSGGTSIFSYKKGAEARHRPEGAWGSNAATGFASSL